MPAPQRVQRQKPGTSPGAEEGMRSVESKIDLIVQKIKNMEKNEEVIGRTLVAQNERIKKLEAQLAVGVGGGASAAEIAELKKAVEAAAKQQDLLELKNVIDQINPLEFARIDQMQEFIRDEIERQLGEREKEKKKT
ncbi:MAG: hypothetical protein QW343_02470 [Candidatus Norongarragalinales archaeon]